MGALLHWFTLAAAIGSGLVAGVFFGFSTFVMRALAALKPAEGIRAMQSINVVVLNPLFLGLFVGVALLAVGLAIAAFLQTPPAAKWPLIVGAALYLIGVFGVTAACNVPRNDALAALNPDTAQAATAWAAYVSEWTFWNHVRTIAGAIAAGCFTLAFGMMRP